MAALSSGWYHISFSERYIGIVFLLRQKCIFVCISSYNLQKFWHNSTCYFLLIRLILIVNDGTYDNDYFLESICECILCFFYRRPFRSFNRTSFMVERIHVLVNIQNVILISKDEWNYAFFLWKKKCFCILKHIKMFLHIKTHK